MIELLSAASRWVAVAGAAFILGSAVFAAWCIRARLPARAPLTRAAPLAGALAVLVGHAGLFAAQALALADSGVPVAGLLSLATGTHVGRIWSLRATVAVLLVLAVAWRRGDCAAARSVPPMLAALYLSLGPLAGHAAGTEPAWAVMALDAGHVLAAAAWVGALPSWWLAVRQFARGEGTLDKAALVEALRRFSYLAMTLVGFVVVSGTVLADVYIDTAGDLFGTSYGVLVLAKVVLLATAVGFANLLRTRSLPSLAAAGAGRARAHARQAARHVSGEIAAVVGVLVCAAWLAQTAPALHEPSPRWWLPFRWSVDATWADPTLRPWIGAAFLVAALGIAAALQRRCHAAGLAILCGTAVLAWALAVPAYPDTYRRSQVPYLTTSVVHGRMLYAEHCVACHGPGGRGDGPLAASLPRPPADLSEPHTALHTAGDMYWWLTHGIPESGMPGFGAALTEEQRWDLINFMRAFSQGFEARLLEPRVVPRQPWLGAINFYIEGGAGPAELKGYRQTRNVLLAVLGGPAAAARAETLADAYPELQKRRTEVLALPLASARLPAVVPYRVVATGGGEIWEAYELLTRTIRNRGWPDRLGMEWSGAELLIDRFGYVRARWIPEDDGAGWSDPAALFRELQRLNAEPPLRAPPDDHVH